MSVGLKGYWINNHHSRVTLMNDTDDFELDDVDSSDEFNDVEENLPVKKVLSKRDVRTQIEDRLEQIELRKLLGDSGYDEVFD
jgi:hypothetical protein